MEELFVGAAAFLLENAASVGIDAGVKSFSDRLSNHALLKTDEKVRDYLMDHLPDYEYEKIDSFLAKWQLYAHSQASADWSTMSVQTEKIIEDFYREHPAFKCQQSTLTPLVKQAICSVYQSVISQLGKDSRILYNQALRNREANRTEHQEIKNELKEIKELLVQTNKKLSYAETVRVYNGMLQVLQSLNCASIAPLITLFENQIDKRDICYCTALKIYTNVLIGAKNEVATLVVQLLRESPSYDLIDNIVLLLLQLEQIDALKVIQSSIENPAMLEVINCYTSENPNDLIERVTDGQGVLKDEYTDNECVLWMFGNCLRSIGNRMKALETYSQIDKKNSSIWSRWRIQEMEASLSFTNFMFNENINISTIKDHVNSLLCFFTMFSQLGEELYVEFVETLLSFAIVLPLKEFEQYYKETTACIRELPKVKRHWYMAHLSYVDSIEGKEIREFCESTNDDELWSRYLFHMAALHPEFVINCIENNKELLEKGFIFIMAYVESIIKVKGKDCTCEFIESFSIPKPLFFECNVYFAEVCTQISSAKAEDYLSAAINEALSPSGNITVIHLWKLVALLVNSDKWEIASNILEKYQDKDPSFMLLRLKVLISHKEYREICCSLTAKLDTFCSNDPYFIYCKGVLMDYDLPGSGMELFEKAFHLCPCPRYAEATLIARLNRNVYLADEVISYAFNSNNIGLLYFAGVTYAKYGRIRESHTALLQALINCNDKYNENLFNAYTTALLGNKEHGTPPETIEPGTCVVIKKDGTEQLRKIWIHTDTTRIPEAGSNFADYEHITPNSSTALSLLGLMQGATVKLSEENYKVMGINHEDVVAMQYCMQKLLEHNVLKQMSIDPNNLESFFEELKKSGATRKQHIDNILENYKSLNPGLTLELFAYGIGSSYYKAMYALSNDIDMTFWAGTDGVEINKNCILTPSTIAILSSLGIYPPALKTEVEIFYATRAMKQELDLQAREHRNDNTAGVLGFDKDGRPYMIENTLENKHNLNLYFACLNEWVNWAKLLEPISPQDFPADIKQVAAAIGISNVEAVTAASQKNMMICCDDLMLRKYMCCIGISSPTAVDVLMYLDYPFELVIDAIKTLLKRKYIFPITVNLLRWISHNFEIAKSEKELEEYALSVIELLRDVESSDELRPYFFKLYRQVVDDQITLHQTLKWIINKELLRFFKRSSDNFQ